MEAKQLSGQLTDEQLNNLETQYGELSEFTTDDGKIAYFKNPSRDILKMATDSVQQGISEYNEVIAQNCFVAGDKTILDDPQYYSSLGKAMNQLAEGVKGTLVKRSRKPQAN